MAGQPVTEAEIQRVRDLHAQGMSRNDIARALGRSGRTVSRIAAEQVPPLTFERGEQVAAATEARKADAKARRAELQLKLLDDAERLRAQLFAPAHAFNFGGRDNTLNETVLSEPTYADKRNIVQAVAAAITTSIKIDEHDRTMDNPSEVDAWLDAMRGPGE